MKTMKPILMPMILLALAHSALAQPAITKKAEEWIEILKKADAPQDERHNACRELGTMNCKAAVPVLASLLPDEKMSHMARYGLEMISDPSADDALRAALAQTRGKLLAGVVSSIGKRRDPRAVEPLAKLLKDADETVAGNAALSLGKIGNADAAKALLTALAAEPANAPRVWVCDGVLACADVMMQAGQKDQAIAIFDTLRQSNAPRHVRMGAIRGAILARGAQGIAVLSEQLAANDDGAFSASMRVAHELRGPDATKAVCDALPKMYEHRQVIALQVLGMRGDTTALPAVVALAKSGQPETRLQAIKILVPLGDASVVPMLLDLAAGSEEKIAAAAQAALVSMPASGVDAALSAAVDKGDPKPRKITIEVLGLRKAAAAAAVLVKAADDPDESIRVAAMKSLGEVGADAQIPALVAMVLKSKAAPELDALEKSLSNICLRGTNKDAASQAVLDGMAKANPEAKKTLLKVIKSSGGIKAYATVLQSTQDADKDIRDIAIRSLCDWPGAEAAADLLKLATASDNVTYKTLALRGYIRLAGNKELANEQRLAMCNQALALSKRDEERRLVLGSLGTIGMTDALDLVLSHLTSPRLKEEACAAAVNIGDLLAEKNPEKVIAAMKQVLKESTNRGTERKARSVTNRANAKPAGK